jgi:hypothetical protein
MRTDPTKAALAALLLLSVACTDHPTPGEPQFEVWPEVRGVITDGTEKGFAVYVDGATGIKRSLPADTATGRFVSAVKELTLPYRVTGFTPSQAMPLLALTFDTGTVNATPLTSLGASQALSEFDIGDLDEPRLLAAQGRMAAYLSETYGITVPSPETNWAALPVTATDGDPGYEEARSLAQALLDAGSSVTQLVEELAQQGSLCRQEKVALGGAAGGVFCPATRASVADENDASKLRFSFIGQKNDSLIVLVEGNNVTSAQFYDIKGNSFGCTACAGITPGTLGVAGERPVVFSNAALGTLTMSGTLTAAPDGVTLPPLYCTDRRFLLIKPDRTAVGRCYDPFPGGVGFSGDRLSWYGFGDNWGFELQTTPAGQVVSMIYTEFDENFQQLPRFACELQGCAGITVGPLVNDVDWGATRRLTFHDTRLAEVQADSTLSTSRFAVLNYSAVMFSLDGQTPPESPVCQDRPDSVLVTGTNGAPPFTFCPPPNDTANFQYTRASFVQEDGEPGVYATDDNINVIQVTQEGAGIRQVFWGGGNSTGMQGNCLGSACAGVTVTPPDGNGVQRMTFVNTILHETRLYGLKLQTERLFTLNGTIGEIIPQPVFSPPAQARTPVSLKHGRSTFTPAGRPGHSGPSARPDRGAAPR